MERLTKQYGNRIYINKAVIPSACSEPKFCKRASCKYAGDRENCPFLKVLYRLAELEQKIENGELIEKGGEGVMAEYEARIEITPYYTPWEIACMLINAEYKYTNILNQDVIGKFFENEDLRRIGEHIINYCETESR